MPIYGEDIADWERRQGGTPFFLTKSERSLLMVCLTIAQREFVDRTTKELTPLQRDVARRDARAVAALVKKISG